jgi:hypothetical protein
VFDEVLDLLYRFGERTTEFTACHHEICESLLHGRCIQASVAREHFLDHSGGISPSLCVPAQAARGRILILFIIFVFMMLLGVGLVMAVVVLVLRKPQLVVVMVVIVLSFQLSFGIFKLIFGENRQG